jgi:NADPH:quinone reductase-like Zn-dependent oxidoreductase
MRAAVYTSTGSARDVLRVEEVERPEPGPGEVLVRACMTANVTLRFILLYGVPDDALDAAVTDVTDALRSGALTELPARRFPLSEVVRAHEAAEGGAVGKVIVTPA